MTKAVILSILACLAQAQWASLQIPPCHSCGNHFIPGEDFHHLEEIEHEGLHDHIDDHIDEQTHEHVHSHMDEGTHTELHLL